MNTQNELNFYVSILNLHDSSMKNKRFLQAESIYQTLLNEFNFPIVNCIETGASQNFEDGCLGFYLAKIVESTGGNFHSVDINEKLVDKSKVEFKKFFSNLNIHHYVSDSVKFLENFTGNVNLVHLDSWDLDLKNPVPSMLHGWLEFAAVKDKMPSGSLVIIDDNYLRNSWVDWITFSEGESISTERIDIQYDIVGKGSLIYHWCQKEESGWDIVGDHYRVGENIKVIVKKR